MILNYFTIFFGFVFGVLLFYNLPYLKSTSYQKDLPRYKLSIIIPARNEEDNLPNILSDLKKQTYDIHEIICVDDNSIDKTPHIIKAYNVIYQSIKNLPTGWKGKPWACQNGAQGASGDLLLFLDADVRLDENAVELLIRTYSKSKKPISVQPYHTVKKQHEYFSLFFNLIEISATGLSFFHSSKTHGFYGPLLLIDRSIFNKFGGYESVKNSVIEDFNLGKQFNKQGVFVESLLGFNSIRFQMYPDRFSQVVEGWTKNFSTGAISTKFWLLFLNLIWIAHLTILPIEIIYAIITKNTLISILLLLVYVFNILFLNRVTKKIGSYPIYVCLLYPIYLLMFHFIFYYSIIATFFIKSTTWKGRKL